MSRGGQVTAEAVRHMLVGLADALRTAQETLSSDARGGDGGGRGYDIPYLDFAFEVEFTSREGEDSTPILALRPRFGVGTSSSTTKDVTSRVSGRLVSVPPHGGRPAPRLDLRLRGEGNSLELEIELTNTAGEALVGVLVALEVDADMTERLTGRLPDSEERLSLLASQAVRTDAEGRARVPILQQGLAPEHRIVIRGEAVGSSARIIVAGAAP